MSCDCGICKRQAEFVRRLELIPECEREYWEWIYSELESAEMDADWANAVIDGSWVDADEVIERARSKVSLTEAGRAMLRDAQQSSPDRQQGE